MYNKPTGCSTPAYGAPHKQTNKKETIGFKALIDIDIDMLNGRKIDEE
jgi:hypothetical protein